MVPWSQLILPILLSVVLVFVASSIVHMVLKLHNPDYRKLPNEDEVRAALRKGSPPPAQYVIPHCLDMQEACTEQMQRKLVEGPVAVISLGRSGPMHMGASLLQWVLYTLAVSLLVAWLARIAVPPAAAYMDIFGVAGLGAWLAYAWQSPADSIWKHKPWAVSFRGLFDGAIYAALTAGCFAWLWPR